MKISEVIAELQTLQEKYGDLSCYNYNQFNDPFNVTPFEVHDYTQTMANGTTGLFLVWVS